MKINGRLVPQAKSRLTQALFGMGLGLCLSLTCLAPAANSAPAQSEAGGPAWVTVQKLVTSFKADTFSQAGTSNCIDFNQIAQRSVGASHWQAMTPAQKQDLTVTVQSLVQNRYFPRWKKIFGKGDVTYVSQSRRDGDTIVTTNLKLGQKIDKLIFQLTGNSPKVVSLTVNQNDLLTKLSQRIQAQQAKGGYQAMMTWLKSKGNVDIADGDSSERHKVSTKPLKTSAQPVDELIL